MQTRCKVVVTKKQPLHRKGYLEPVDGEEPYAYMIECGPCAYGTSVENASFFEATPSISISLGVVNPGGASVFKLGQEMFVDFIPVEVASKPAD